MSTSHVVTPVNDNLSFPQKGILSFITHKDSPYYEPTHRAGIVDIPKRDLWEPLVQAFAHTLQFRGHQFAEILQLYNQLPDFVTFRVNHQT
jgi:hypothetical protein